MTFSWNSSVIIYDNVFRKTNYRLCSIYSNNYRFRARCLYVLNWWPFSIKQVQRRSFPEQHLQACWSCAAWFCGSFLVPTLKVRAFAVRLKKGRSAATCRSSENLHYGFRFLVCCPWLRNSSSAFLPGSRNPRGDCYYHPPLEFGRVAHKAAISLHWCNFGHQLKVSLCFLQPKVPDALMTFKTVS